MTDTILRDLPDVLTKAENLPSLPTVAVEILHLARDEDSSLDDIARVLAMDPALSAKLLKLSNSSLFNMGQEVTTIQRATMVLGLKTVTLMSLSFSLAGSLPGRGKEGHFSYLEYWRRSLTAAVSGRMIAGRVGNCDGDEAFLCGLLGHLGRLAIQRCIPDDYAEVLAQNAWPSLSQEEEHLGFNSADVGAALMAEWNLPDRLSKSIAFAPRPTELAASEDVQTRTLVEVMHVAGLVEAFLFQEEKGARLKDLHETCKDYYDMEPGEVEAFLMELEGDIYEAAQVLQLDLPDGLEHEQILSRAREELVLVSLRAITGEKQATQSLNALEDRHKRLEEQNRELENRALTDRLTGLPNRAAFDDFLSRQVHSRIRGEVPRALGIILADVDHFKKFNDAHGHQAGDEVLKRVGAVLKRTTRGGDLAARYGGEEFVIVLPHTTPFGIKQAAERLRKAVEEESIEFEGQTLSVTASFGAACVASLDSETDGKILTKLADQSLYRAKERGRNRCEVVSKGRLR